MSAELPAIGILVGGQGLRMGGAAKANLLIGGRTILERTLSVCRRAALSVGGPAAPALAIWLVGDSSAYAASGVERVADDPAGQGPIGGVRAFLREVLPRGRPGVVLAGDLPYITVELLVKLFQTAPGSAALAPRDEEGRWEPLFARYQPELLLPEIEAALALGRTSLQYLFERLGDRAVALPLSPAEWRALRDWDRPSDVTSGCPEAPE